MAVIMDPSPSYHFIKDFEWLVTNVVAGDIKGYENACNALGNPIYTSLAVELKERLIKKESIHHQVPKWQASHKLRHQWRRPPEPPAESEHRDFPQLQLLHLTSADSPSNQPPPLVRDSKEVQHPSVLPNQSPALARVKARRAVQLPSVKASKVVSSHSVKASN